MHSDLLDTLQDAAVRDLAWVIASPGLLDASHLPYAGKVVDDAWCKTQIELNAAWLKSLDASPHELHEFIAAHPTRRLGHYFETLLTFWLKHQPQVQIVATNLQVQHEQRTLGEYDFLFQGADAEVYHWEAAVKFYLQQEPVAKQHAFIGPGTRDRLDLKLNKVFQQQLMLGLTTAGQQALPAGIGITKTQAFIKGYLFYHGSNKHNGESIEGVSPAHLTGWWVRHALEKIPMLDPKSHWLILPRLAWLAPARVKESTAVMDSSTLQQNLQEHFNLHQDAILIFEVTQISTGEYIEISRGFVVSETWPSMSSGILTI